MILMHWPSNSAQIDETTTPCKPTPKNKRRLRYMDPSQAQAESINIYSTHADTYKSIEHYRTMQYVGSQRYEHHNTRKNGWRSLSA